MILNSEIEEDSQFNISGSGVPNEADYNVLLHNKILQYQGIWRTRIRILTDVRKEITLIFLKSDAAVLTLLY
jgi:hypothetical protein